MLLPAGSLDAYVRAVLFAPMLSCRRRDVRSVRDITREHLDLLKNIRDKSREGRLYLAPVF